MPVDISQFGCGKLRIRRAPTRRIQPPAELYMHPHRTSPARSVFGLKGGRLTLPHPAVRLT